MIPNHYKARHNQYKNFLPNSLKWMQSTDNIAAFEKCNSTIYYADQDTAILLMWHNDKIIVNIDLYIIEPKFRILIVELLAQNETEALMDDAEGLVEMLFDQGLELAL